MPIKLLFADDSVTIQKVVELAFESEDVAVTVVGSGEEALERLKESRPDIIIADVVMPEMNGLELCERVKTDKEYCNIPFLLLRSEFDDFDAALIGRVGADDCITKPFKSEELIKKIRDIAGEKNVGQTMVTPPPEEVSLMNQSPEPLTEKQVDLDIDDDVNRGEPKEAGDILILEPENEITNESLVSTMDITIEHNEPYPSVEVISPEIKIQEEDLNISGLLNNEEIERIRNEIKKKEEELLISLLDEEEERLAGLQIGIEEDSLFSPPPPAEPSADVKNFIAELERNSITSEKIKGIIIKATEDVFEKTFRDFLEKTVKESTENIMKDTTEKMLLSLTPQILKTVENVVWEIVPDMTESFIKKEIEKIKDSEIE
jgi:CheY-like chemotaxis protein